MSKNRLSGLLAERHAKAINTEQKLIDALERFEQSKFIRLPENAELTLRNLAIEAEVSKDTPFSRFKKNHPRFGEYRFPAVVEKFSEVKLKLAEKAVNKKDSENILLRERNIELEQKFISQMRVINALDTEKQKLKKEIEALKELVKNHQPSPKVLSFKDRR